jgi:hypothetical protein
MAWKLSKYNFEELECEVTCEDKGILEDYAELMNPTKDANILTVITPFKD